MKPLATKRNIREAQEHSLGEESLRTSARELGVSDKDNLALPLGGGALEQV